MSNINKMIKIYGAFIIVLALILTTSLSRLTISKGSEYEDSAEEKKLRTVSVSGQRGEITDRNGVVLATNRKSFSVKFNRDVSKTTAADRAMYTQSLLKAINIIEENGGEIIDVLNIKRDENGEFYFDFNIQDEKKFNQRKDRWKKNFYFDSKTKEYTVEEMYTALRKRYGIPETADYETARKLLSIWQEVQMNAYQSYVDIIIAKDVDMVTISELETQNFYEDCIQIKEGYIRVYPKGNTASHVIGYIGKQTKEDTIKANAELGYSADDEVGISGIEASLERQLTGNTSDKKGYRVVEVNNMGKVIREIQTAEAVSGDNVMLTIDYELQKKAEEALAENIRLVREEQEELYKKDKSHYDKKVAERGSGDNKKPIAMANQGAAVVMDVKTGEVLAMVSYPDYDANVFVGGINDDVYKEFSEDPSAPLYNKAISGGTPGSIFKMVTAVAALMEGDITVNETIDDGGMYTRHLSNKNAVGPKCWTSTPSKHKAQNVSRAIQNSCNYYFYEISYRMGVEKIVKWADQLGLTSSTNIELGGEVTGQVGDQKVLYDNTKGSKEQRTGMAVLVRIQIEGYLKKYMAELKISHSDKEITDTAEKLIKLVDGSDKSYGNEIRNILNEELDIPVATSYARRWDTEIAASIIQLRWNDNDTITTGIGQGITIVTPVAVARYVSALVNGGKVFDARLVKSTSSADGVVTEKQSRLYNTVDIKQEYLNAIKQGMQNVISHEDGSSVGKYFSSWSDEQRKQLAGKTGTGQISQIDLENNAWFAAFAPYDDPEIAVVVFIPNGYAGSRAAYTVEKIVSLYFERKGRQNAETLNKRNVVMEKE